MHFAGLDPKSTRSSARTPGNAFETPSISIRAVKLSVPPSAFANMTIAGARRSHKLRAGENERAPPDEVVGGARSASLFPALRQPPGVAAVCRSDGITTHFGSSLWSFRYWVMTG